MSDDRLADVLAEAYEAWEEDTRASLSQVLADAIRTALADGSLTPEDLGMVDDGSWVHPDDLSVHYEDETRPGSAVTLYRLPSKEVTDG